MKVLGVKQFHQKTFKFLNLDNSPMKGILGNIPRQFIAVVKGASGNGKTEFLVQLSKELCRHGKVGYLHYEQGHGADFQMATKRNRMEDVSGQFYPIDPWANLKPEISLIEDLDKYLSRRNSPDFIFIDSTDDTGFQIADYQHLKHKYGKKKAFIFVARSSKSGALKKSVTDHIAFDGQLTIFVSNYIAHPEKNRCGGVDSYVIWEEEARKRNPIFFAKQMKAEKKAPHRRKINNSTNQQLDK